MMLAPNLSTVQPGRVPESNLHPIFQLALAPFAPPPVERAPTAAELEAARNAGILREQVRGEA